MDELARLKDVRPRIEKEIQLPGVKDRVYMFSIDGSLDGARVTGCLYAGSCAMVHAGSFEDAFKLAREAIAHTVTLAERYFEESHRLVMVEDRPLAPENLAIESGGRKGMHEPRRPALLTDPKLMAMMRAKMEGKPWPG
jgi:hypothetical protein